ncbi:hypothetical protein DRN69_07270 [Candidatus Pacearchaeota archaeon]|nr:MAG: hypothetical protein DRN69_07270 [Candidatus Pacearchaeota archaeon]
MAYTTVEKVRLLSNLTTADVSDNDVTNLIAEATKELNRLINVKVIREKVEYIDEYRKNTIDGSNTTFYVKNWKDKYLADMDNDGDVDTDDIEVIIADPTNNTETTATVSSISANEGKFVLSSAPDSGKELYVTYEWCYRNPSTPDPLISLACTFLTIAYCYAKINVGRAPQVAFGNTRVYRHIDSYDHYYRRFLKIVTQINNRMSDYKEAETF